MNMMNNALQKSGLIVKQCEQLFQLVSNFNKTIDTSITTTRDEMNQLLASVRQNIEETTVTVVNDLKEWEQLKTNLSKTQLNGKVLLDVGGREFSTRVETLTVEKNSFFTALFSRQWQLEKDEKGRIFIDRNGDLFAEILDFMRSPNEYVLPDERTRRRLIREAKFYKLDSFLITLTELCAFAGDILLSAHQKQILNDFYGVSDQRWDLIYQATRDGFESTTFHRLCDYQGPTMVVIRSTEGYLFGGYASKSWSPTAGYIDAPNSFLFLLTNANGNQPTKFVCKKNSNALHGGIQYGPVFGNGNDLYINDKSNTNTSSVCRISDTSSYENTLQLGNNTFTGGGNFQTSEIEVFKLAH